jgi:hypothetical protein
MHFPAVCENAISSFSIAESNRVNSSTSADFGFGVSLNVTAATLLASAEKSRDRLR